MHHILYHDSCADGFLSYVLLRHLLETRFGVRGADIFRHACQYKRPLPLGPLDLKPEDSVFIVDFSSPNGTAEERQQLIDMHDAVQGKMRVFDHHETVPESFKDLPFFQYDATRSGVGIVWDQLGPGCPLPEVARLIQWRDLGGAFQQPQERDSLLAHALHAGLMRLLPRQYRAWLEILIYEHKAEHLIRAGIELRQRDDLVTRSAAERPHWLEIGGYIVPAVDGLGPGLSSDACHALLERYPNAPFAVSWFVDSKPDPHGSHIVLSLRGRQGGVHVGQIAVTNGGGGHAAAAGYSLLGPLPVVADPQ